MIVLSLFLISFIMVFIIDYSGFITELENILTIITKSTFKIHIPKPFSCSLCMTFWLGLIYLILCSMFTLTNIVWVCVFSALTIVLSQFMVLIRDLILNVMIKLNSWINKLN